MHVLLELRKQAAHKDLGFAIRGSHFVNQGDFGTQITICLTKMLNRTALLTLNQHFDRAVRELEQLQNSCNGTDAIQGVFARIVVSRILLSQQQNLLVARHRSLKGLDRLLASHEQWDHHVRINHNIAQWQERQFDGCLHDFASTAAIRP